MKDLSEARRIVEQQRGEIESLKAKLRELALLARGQAVVIEYA